MHASQARITCTSSVSLYKRIAQDQGLNGLYYHRPHMDLERNLEIRVHGTDYESGLPMMRGGLPHTRVAHSIL